jgi:hypothetical protein
MDGINRYMLIRSEQDKEPEQETISEVVGPGPTVESSVDGMWLSLQHP